MSMARVAAVFALAAAVFAAHAGRAAAAPPQELVVFEAASLKDAFAGLAQKFQAEHAGIKVTANPAGSQELRMQIEHGAKADVFASADLKHMDKLRQAGLVVAPNIFACNQPVLVVRPGSRVKVFGSFPTSSGWSSARPTSPSARTPIKSWRPLARSSAPTGRSATGAHRVARAERPAGAGQGHAGRS